MLLPEFLKKAENKTATVGVVGLGYVGLPLAIAFAARGFRTLGFDIDPKKPELIEWGKSYLKHIPAESFAGYVKDGKLTATTDFSRAAECDALIICVPTPLGESREPDTSFIESTAETLSQYLQTGQLVSLESTTYPGTTEGLLRRVLEEGSGLEAGEDFFLVYSPEREDPGNEAYHTRNIPKVLGAYSPACLEAGRALYGAVVAKVVEVGSCAAAEMTKLFENVYRAVNIALVNELKTICDRMDLDVWEVIAAADTKPFGFQAFWPGPGLGGHCIPIDPFYLTWAARRHDISTRFIELAGEINTSMPYFVVEKVKDALNSREKPLAGSDVLVLGVAYKPGVDDMRESPALTIIDLLTRGGAHVAYHDPHVKKLEPTRKYSFDLQSVPLDAGTLSEADCVVVVTNHPGVDYELVAREADIVVDTRNCVPRDWENVVLA